MGAIYDSLIKRFPDFPRTQEIEDFVVNLTREMDPLMIIMFGALPRGDYTFNSDVDVLLIFDEPVTWNEVFVYSKGVVQPIAKTRDNFITHLKKGNAFFIQIMEEGIILHAKEGTLENFKEIAAETIGKLKMDRVEKGWDDLEPENEEYED
ncbi:nucleotidyltransferase domain-containing protein [bacterium]|nr:nucleotidyltransferase domain-containing protein [candidate division CSSED10-310 bacterium]